MIRKILKEIRDPADFSAALTLLKQVGPDAALTDRDWEALLELYTRYMPEEDKAGGPDFVRLCLAADAMMVMPQADKEQFAALGLGPDETDALFRVRELAAGQEDLSAPQAQELAELAGNDALSDPARTVLARAALDGMVCSRYYPELREQTALLAEYLSGRGAEELDRCTELLSEVRSRCRG